MLFKNTAQLSADDKWKEAFKIPSNTDRKL